MRACVCVCVCEREREREREYMLLQGWRAGTRAGIELTLINNPSQCWEGRRTLPIDLILIVNSCRIDTSS